MITCTSFERLLVLFVVLCATARAGTILSPVQECVLAVEEPAVYERNLELVREIPVKGYVSFEIGSQWSSEYLSELKRELISFVPPQRVDKGRYRVRSTYDEEAAFFSKEIAQPVVRLGNLGARVMNAKMNLGDWEVYPYVVLIVLESAYRSEPFVPGFHNHEFLEDEFATLNLSLSGGGMVYKEGSVVKSVPLHEGFLFLGPMWNRVVKPRLQVPLLEHGSPEVVEEDRLVAIVRYHLRKKTN